MTMTSGRRDYLIEMSERTGGFIGQALAEILDALPVNDEGEGRYTLQSDGVSWKPKSAPVEGDAARWRGAVAVYRGTFNRETTRPYDDDLAAVKAIVAKAPRA